MKEQLRKLVELQEIDSLLDSIQNQIEEIPRQVGLLNQEVQAKESSLNELKKNLTQLQVARKEKELELKSKEEQLKKHQTELFNVKTNEAYAALLKEIEEDKRLISTIEDEVLRMMDEEDSFITRERAGREELNKEKDEVARKQKELEEKLEQLQKNLKEVQLEQRKKVAEIEPQILARYQRIREKKDGLAVVPIVNGFCGGCNIVVPPQMINDVLRGQELVSCGNCLRILYIKNEK